jgi:hypothetical protein
MRRVKVALIQRAFLGHYCPLLLQKRALIGLCHTGSFGRQARLSRRYRQAAQAGVLAFADRPVGEYTRN